MTNKCFYKKRLVRLPPLTSPILKIKQLNQTKKIITKKLKINTFYFLKIFLARNIFYFLFLTQQL